MQLTGRDKRILRASAHHLQPAVLIGADRLTDGLVGEVDRQLEQRELVKAKLIDADKEEVSQALQALVERTGATHVQTIGHVVVLFRRNPDPDKRRIPPLPSEAGAGGGQKG